MTESPNSLSVSSYPQSYKVLQKSILGRICRNTLTIAKTNTEMLDLTKFQEEELLAKMNFEFTDEEKKSALNLKSELFGLKHGRS